MKKLIVLYCLLAFHFSNYEVKAQETEVLTDVIQVAFNEKNDPLLVQITNPGDFRDAMDVGYMFKPGINKIQGYITDSDGLEQVSINGIKLPLKENGFFSMNLYLREGDDAIEIKGLDSKGVNQIQSYKILVGDNNGPMLSAGNYHALLIGVDEYNDELISDLDKPIEDATLLKETLVGEYNFEEKNVSLLKNPTRSEIIDAIDLLSDRIVENVDNVLIFYAGHGYWDTEDEIGYWIPSDGRKSSTAEWFRNSTLTNQIRSIRSRHTLLIADACFSGAIFKARSAFLDADKATKLKYSLPSRKAMTSGTLTKVPDKSAFIKYLVKRLEENTKKYLAASDLFYSMESAIINNSDSEIKPQYGTIQKVGDEGGDFIFIKKD